MPSGVQEIQNTINVCHCTSVISLLKYSQCFSKYSHLQTECLEWSWMCVCSDLLPSAGVRENDEGAQDKTMLHTSCGKNWVMQMRMLMNLPFIT